MANTQKVLCSDDVWRTFTQRGRDKDAGFVRVNGVTVTGFSHPSNDGWMLFTPWVSRTNGLVLGPIHANPQ